LLELVGMVQTSSSSSQTVGIALTEVQTLVELEEVTVQHSVSYLVVVFTPCFLEETELLLELLGLGQ